MIEVPMLTVLTVLRGNLCCLHSPFPFFWDSKTTIVLPKNIEKDLKVRLCYQFPSEDYKKSLFLFSRIKDAMVNSTLWPVTVLWGLQFEGENMVRTDGHKMVKAMKNIMWYDYTGNSYENVTRAFLLFWLFWTKIFFFISSFQTASTAYSEIWDIGHLLFMHISIISGIPDVWSMMDSSSLPMGHVVVGIMVISQCL